MTYTVAVRKKVPVIVQSQRIMLPDFMIGG